MSPRFAILAVVALTDGCILSLGRLICDRRSLGLSGPTVASTAVGGLGKRVSLA